MGSSVRGLVVWAAAALLAIAPASCLKETRSGGVTAPDADPGPGDPAADTAPLPDPGAEDDGAAGPETAPDLPAEVGPDAAPDVVIPTGCCRDDTDCLAATTVGKSICVGPGPGPPGALGSCVSAAVDEGWCWRDSDCGPGERCHGAAACACNLDCDFPYLGPGVCVDDASDCKAIDPSWVKEWCDAASVVIWDGDQCVATCPGCCECGPFCDYTFPTFDECRASCERQECPAWEAALAESNYIWRQRPQELCPSVVPMNAACETDAQCLAWGDGDTGDLCVLGNCVWCWSDAGCPDGTLCRAGRCVEAPDEAECPAIGSCSHAGCHSFDPSEVPCPSCACESLWSTPCTEDMQCLVFSFHPYSRCVYGRCTDCKNDADCPWGACVPPGFCFETVPPANVLYGTWLLGWFGGMDHFSYFRFEPDGTLRRGSYEPEGAWSDDIPALPCWPDGGGFGPLTGTWEPEMNASGSLVVRLRLNVSCDAADGWSTRYLVSPMDAWPGYTFTHVDGDQDLTGWRVAPSSCLPDFSACSAPDAAPTP